MSRKYILGHRARTRSRAIRFTVMIGLLLITLAILQVSIFSRFRVLKAVPDLMICTVLCLAFFCGRYTGAISGIAAGFLIEAIGSTGIVLLPVCYFLLGYIAGHFARAVIPKRYSSYLVYLTVTLFCRAAITVLYSCLTHRDVHIPMILLQSVLPEMLVTAIVGLVLYFPMKLFCGLLDQN